MAGSVIWKRDVVGVPRKWKYTNNGMVTQGVLPSASLFSSPVIPRQEISSFRTGKGSPNENDEVIPTDFPTAFRGWWLENRDASALSRGDTGHPFWTYKDTLTLPGDCDLSSYPGGEVRYVGPIYSDSRYHSVRGAEYPHQATPDLTWYGTRAIAETAPTNPVADVGQLLAELYREALPRLVGQALKDTIGFFRGLGSEYLNIEFGWKPFIDDLNDILYTVRNANRILAQFERDRGRQVRRSYRFPAKREVLLLKEGGGAICNVPNNSNWLKIFPYGEIGSLRETISKDESVWFSGAYTYHSPLSKGFLADLKVVEQKVNRLFGLRITPELLWELAPWSWLVDWIGSVGDVAHNLSSFSNDSLILVYGYLTCVTTHTRTCTVSGVKYGNVNSPSTLPPQTTTYSTRRVERVQGTPYGFGLNPDGFTDRQKAIITAVLHQRSK